jgi:hypothetical protein
LEELGSGLAAIEAAEDHAKEIGSHAATKDAQSGEWGFVYTLPN